MSHWINHLIMGCVCSNETVSVDGRPFYVKGRLGEGGFSFVDLVEDRHRQQYALKRIACHSKSDESVALAEVEYMRRLDHPNLVKLEAAEKRAINQAASSLTAEVLIIMPFFKKGTLFNELETLQLKREHMRELRLLRVFRGICHGLQHLHNLKPTPLAHRDMKPHNVLMGEDDTPVLMDFGSMGTARVEIRSQSDGLALQDLAAERCSMPYRAPELFNVDTYATIDERVDIWSLGCTLYAMCYHESPFDAAYMRGDSVALAVLGGNIKFPNSSVYSNDLQDVIRGMLVVNVMERPYISWVLDRVKALLDKAENRI